MPEVKNTNCLFRRARDDARESGDTRWVFVVLSIELSSSLWQWITIRKKSGLVAQKRRTALS